MSSREVLRTLLSAQKSFVANELEVLWFGFNHIWLNLALGELYIKGRVDLVVNTVKGGEVYLNTVFIFEMRCIRARWPDLRRMPK